MVNDKKQSFKEWFNDSWENKITTIIGVSTLILTLIFGIPQLKQALVNTPMSEQLEVYYNRHYSFIQDIEPIIPKDSLKMCFYQEALVAKKDFQNIKIVMQTIKELEQINRKTYKKDVKKIQLLESRAIVALTAEMTSMKEFEEQHNKFHNELRTFNIFDRDYTAAAKINNSAVIDKKFAMLVDLIQKQEDNAYKIYLNTIQPYTNSQKKYFVPLQDIQNNPQSANANPYKVLVTLKKFISSKEHKDYLESLMAYYEFKYTSCCLLLQQNHDNE